MKMNGYNLRSLEMDPSLFEQLDWIEAASIRRLQQFQTYTVTSFSSVNIRVSSVETQSLHLAYLT